MKKLIVSLVVFVALSPVMASAAPVRCECVRALRELRGVNIPRGNAGTHKPNIPLTFVQIGDVLLQKIGKVSHVSLIIGVDTVGVIEGGRHVARPTSLEVWECNYKSCQCGTRTIPILDPDIRGVLRTVW